MKINETKVVILEAETGNELYNLKDPSISGQVISLGKHDSVDNWMERPITSSNQQEATARNMPAMSNHSPVAQASNFIVYFKNKIKCILSYRKKSPQ
jgi:hypothetical protein